MKNVNPFISLLIIAGIFVAGIFIGKSKWFNDLLSKVLPTPAPLPNGTACTMPDGSAGKINGGVCVKDIGVPNTSPVERTKSNSSEDKLSTPNAPEFLLVPVGTKTPFSHMGCTYGKPYASGNQWVVTKISCP